MIAAMPRMTSPIFVGRAAELTQLRHALWLAAGGQPSTRLVAGDAGIGKTRLTAEFVTAARGSGAQVLIGDCLPLGDSGLPYAPFVGALRLLGRCPLIGSRRSSDPVAPSCRACCPTSPRRQRSALVRSSPRTDAGSPRHGCLHHSRPVPPAGRRRCRAGARGPPLGRCVDEDLLLFLVRNARDARILFVGTYRSDELHRRHPLRPLLAEPGGSRASTTSSCARSAATTWPTWWRASPARCRTPSS